MPLTVFDTKGISATRRERIEQAVVVAGKHLREPYAAWLSTDPFRGGVGVMITDLNGFQRQAAFAMDEEPAAWLVLWQSVADKYGCFREAPVLGNHHAEGQAPNSTHFCVRFELIPDCHVL